MQSQSERVTTFTFFFNKKWLSQRGFAWWLMSSISCSLFSYFFIFLCNTDKKKDKSKNVWNKLLWLPCSLSYCSLILLLLLFSLRQERRVKLTLLFNTHAISCWILSLFYFNFHFYSIFSRHRVSRNECNLVHLTFSFHLFTQWYRRWRKRRERERK